jgi:hypothetical protein
MRISFLHTIDGNRQVFEQAARDLGLHADDLRHEVRADLREAVQQAGTFPIDLRKETSRCLLELAAHADAVVLTCATLGPAVAEIENSPAPIVRADAALAAASAKAGGTIAVLCAAESAIEPTRKLFTEHARENNASVEVVHLARAWALFQSGDLDACFTEIASSAEQAYDAGATVVAFAHPWMSPAVQLAGKRRRPLDSAHAALRSAMQQFHQRSAGN